MHPAVQNKNWKDLTKNSKNFQRFNKDSDKIIISQKWMIKTQFEFNELDNGVEGTSNLKQLFMLRSWLEKLSNCIQETCTIYLRKVHINC